MIGWDFSFGSGSNKKDKKNLASISIKKNKKEPKRARRLFFISQFK